MKEVEKILGLGDDLKQEILNISLELRKGDELKEEFLDIINHADYKDCKVQLLNWMDLCLQSEIPEFIEASKTINNWLEYICNSFKDERYSNGFTEGMNNKIKVINPFASPCAGAPVLKYGDVNIMTQFPGEVKGLINIPYLV